MTSRALLLAAAASLTLAACSQSTETAEAPAATTDATATTTTTETTAAAPATGANPMVGGAEMLPTRNIVENAVNSRDHTTLVAAVQQAGLAETLSGAGPFTVFAPTNAAFEAVPAATREALMAPTGREQLTGVLTYHVVPGRVTAADLTRQITEGGGSATLTTVQGGTLTARADGDAVVITDSSGGRSRVTQADGLQSTGVIHVGDAVLVPRG